MRTLIKAAYVLVLTGILAVLAFIGAAVSAIWIAFQFVMVGLATVFLVAVALVEWLRPRKPP